MFQLALLVCFIRFPYICSVAETRCIHILCSITVRLGAARLGVPDIHVKTLVILNVITGLLLLHIYDVHDVRHVCCASISFVVVQISFARDVCDVVVAVSTSPPGGNQVGGLPPAASSSC